jgi:two-component system NarL family sensor kinase
MGPFLGEVMDDWPVIPVLSGEPIGGSSPDSTSVPGACTNLQGNSTRRDFVETFQQIVNGLREQIALLDDQWTILAANPAWTRTARLYGYDALIAGTNYLEFCSARANEGHTPARLVADGIREMERSGDTSFTFTYHGKDRWEGHSFQICIDRFEVDGRRYASTTRYEVTELVHLRQMREEFSHSLIQHQGVERRRMAREVHDSTMQLLAGMGLSLVQLKRSRHSKAAHTTIEEIEKLLADAQRELRAMAYLAHAPEVSELGLARALRQLAGGFGKRTGLTIALQIDDPPPLSTAAQVAIYRMTQEALSNIHRHSRATDAVVGLHLRRSTVFVVVADNGVGVPQRLRKGVGLSSMHDRIEELGGRLMIRAGNPGTVLIASIPAHAETRRIGDLARA